MSSVKGLGNDTRDYKGRALLPPDLFIKISMIGKVDRGRQRYCLYFSWA